MLVYIIVCSLIGSISVVFTQGLGSAIVHSITYKNENQFTNWFIYIVLGIVVVTLLVEIVYLNKALNLFNTALVTPTYYVIFTTLTIVSSILLYQGFDTSSVNIATCFLGFLCICSGIALLHNSKSDPTASTINTDEEKAMSARSLSMFQMFENNEDTAPHPGHQPGAADLFPAPFSGFSRYTSTPRRSQTMVVNKGLNSSLMEEVTKRKAHSDNVSAGHATVKREDSVEEEQTSIVFSPVDIPESIHSKHSVETKSLYIKRDHSTSFSSHGTRRAQDELDPISSFKLKINRGTSEDRETLVNSEDV
ncbi:hypothetical protein G6F56_003242 [Rhizopus delemar]|nr:hypothetical protein G6F56_003242 [Rhizopus delemar]